MPDSYRCKKGRGCCHGPCSYNTFSVAEAGRFSPPARELTLFFFLDLDYFPPVVVPAVGADGVVQALLAAVAAGDERHGREGIVCPAAVAAAFGVLAFRMRRHDDFPFSTSAKQRLPKMLAGNGGIIRGREMAVKDRRA